MGFVVRLRTFAILESSGAGDVRPICTNDIVVITAAAAMTKISPLLFSNVLVHHWRGSG